MLDPRPGAPVVSNPPTSDVQQRWQADRDAIAAPDPWQHSPDKRWRAIDPRLRSRLMSELAKLRWNAKRSALPPVSQQETVYGPTD
jgi:hypothetical protein